MGFSNALGALQQQLNDIANRISGSRSGNANSGRGSAGDRSGRGSNGYAGNPHAPTTTQRSGGWQSPFSGSNILSSMSSGSYGEPLAGGSYSAQAATSAGGAEQQEPQKLFDYGKGRNFDYPFREYDENIREAQEKGREEWNENSTNLADAINAITNTFRKSSDIASGRAEGIENGGWIGDGNKADKNAGGSENSKGLGSANQAYYSGMNPSGRSSDKPLFNDERINDSMNALSNSNSAEMYYNGMNPGGRGLELDPELQAQRDALLGGNGAGEIATNGQQDTGDQYGESSGGAVGGSDEGSDNENGEPGSTGQNSEDKDNANPESAAQDELGLDTDNDGIITFDEAVAGYKDDDAYTRALEQAFLDTYYADQFAGWADFQGRGSKEQWQQASEVMPSLSWIGNEYGSFDDYWDEVMAFDLANMQLNADMMDEDYARMLNNMLGTVGEDIVDLSQYLLDNGYAFYIDPNSIDYFANRVDDDTIGAYAQNLYNNNLIGIDPRYGGEDGIFYRDASTGLTSNDILNQLIQANAISNAALGWDYQLDENDLNVIADALGTGVNFTTDADADNVSYDYRSLAPGYQAFVPSITQDYLLTEDLADPYRFFGSAVHAANPELGWYEIEG